MLCLIASALAGVAVKAALPWSVAAYDPGGDEAVARGPQYLAALPDGRVAFYDPVRPAVVVAGAGRTHRVPLAGVTDLAATPDGALLVLFDAERRVELRSADGALLDDAPLPGLAPQGARLVVTGSDARLADVFGNLHRGWTLDGALEPAPGPALVRPAARAVWDGAGFAVGQARVEVPGALRASGVLVGEWLVVDAVVDDAPIAVRRVAHHLPSGAETPLSLDDRPYAPRGEYALAPDGALLVLRPTSARLEILRVTP